jgi:peptidoglycan/LPS O-acetylase OafA/YrhL
MKLGQVFDPRKNALNVWRLVLASAVILQHSWPLTGHTAPGLNSLYDVSVDGFFVLSGFLITASWVRKPRLREYFAARSLRIFPGLWVCLIVVAFVIAPIGVAIQGGSAKNLLMSTAPTEYVLNNAVLNVYHAGIAGTPRGVPWPGVWDGTLWTLIFELFCYIGVAVAGVVGLLGRWWAAPVAFVLAVCLAAAVFYPQALVQTIPQMIARFAVVFLAGVLVHQFRDVIPARWSLVAVLLVFAIASAVLMPNYRLVAAIPLAYGVIVSGALIHTERFRLRTDLSYGVYIYGWPMEQLLVICGLGFLNPFVFAIVALAATLPLAALSWFLIEKRAMSLKPRFTDKRLNLPPVTVQQEATSS